MLLDVLVPDESLLALESDVDELPEVPLEPELDPEEDEEDESDFLFPGEL